MYGWVIPSIWYHLSPHDIMWYIFSKNGLILVSKCSSYKVTAITTIEHKKYALDLNMHRLKKSAGATHREDDRYGGQVQEKQRTTGGAARGG